MNKSLLKCLETVSRYSVAHDLRGRDRAPGYYFFGPKGTTYLKGSDMRSLISSGMLYAFPDGCREFEWIRVTDMGRSALRAGTNRSRGVEIAPGSPLAIVLDTLRFR